MVNRLRGLCLVCLCLLLLPVSANAQTAASATLTAPKTEAFPLIEAFLDVRDAQGNFVHGLQATDLRVLEDDVEIPAAELSELRQGVQLVVAFNPGPSFAIRNSQGDSRFDYLVEVLTQWAKSRQGSTIDDWSLLTTQGPQISHVSDPMRWLQAFNMEGVDARQATPDLGTLLRALDIAADPNARPGLGRAILFITPPVEGDVAVPLENIIERARQERVRISVWMVASLGAYSSQVADQMAGLAAQTGGHFLAYSGEEPLPSPEDYLEPLRAVYRLDYESRANSSGAHQLVVEIQTPEGQVSTQGQSFELAIQPPNPVFITPSLEIVRRLPVTEDAEPNAEIPLQDYSPTEQDLEVLVDFPDGRVRSLVRSALYVDGAPVEIKTAPPFDKFTWDLRSYTLGGEHVLRVEVEDSLGLVGSSIDTVVNVAVESPQQDTWQLVSRQMPVLASLAILMAGAVLLLVLVLGGRIRPLPPGMQRKPRRKSDPVTQPVVVKEEPGMRRLPNWVNRLQWPQRRVAPQAYAFLTRIAESEESPAPSPTPITSDEITLGSDPNQATLMLNDPSVEGLHARLIRKDEDNFRLCDEGSVAGTWINYTPVSREGARLEHGDLIHVGRVAFRFTLRRPGQVRRPVITLEESEL